jgi:mono/diheme cytochrome c family protein
MSNDAPRILKSLACIFLFSALGIAGQEGGVQTVDFARDIQPIFAQHCYQCHSAKKASGQLRLDSRAVAMKGGISGAAIIPGKSRESRLLQRLRGENDQARMPMGGDPLKPEQVELIRRWIDLGATWPDGERESGRAGERESGLPKHWAYVKPVRPELPYVKNRDWVRTPVDAFILSRLEKERLAPSPEAESALLLRRAYLDLTGLPPSPREVDDFLADTSSDAYEKVVDRLLSSPHYGERWARPWLDLARYADSHGYEKDRPRVMWKYRDWVIDALNKDMPFDQFTIEQLAGDMLPKPSDDQLIATGFHRNTMLNQEGGVDDEEARWETIIDRVNTTATVWLGSTIGCAQCHNHKYDPFSQKDYYKLFAFFDSHDYNILEMPGSEGWVIEPELELPTPQQAERRKELRAEISSLEAKLMTQTQELDSAMGKWETDLRAEPSTWRVLDPLVYKSSGGTRLEKLDDKSLFASGAHPANEVYTVTAQLPATQQQGLTAIRLEAMADERLPLGGPGRDPYGNFVLSGIEVLASPASDPAKSQRVLLSNAVANDFAGRPDLKQLLCNDGPVNTNGWAIDATRDLKRLNREMVFIFDQPLKFAEAFTLTVKVKQLTRFIAQGLGRIRLSVIESEDPAFIVSLPVKFTPLLLIAPERRTEKQKSDLAEQFRQLTPLLKGERDRVRELRDGMEKLGIVKAQIIREKQTFERPSTYLRERGNYLTKGEKVYAAAPRSLHPWPDDAPYNRLGLARWLVSHENPLTARVTVNRIWEQFFGRGIVETSEDFGTQSSPPSHPELLDWLAIEFMESGWSMKKLHRLIVTSATYRQASTVKPSLQQRDPYNRLLARGPRFRLEAEMIRDGALAASGLLSRRTGGPSVYPPQPEGIWMNPYDGNIIKWVTSGGEDRHRRSLYTFIRRTAPYPMMTTFDATSREYCTVRRVRTNTPLQALTLFNDEAMFEVSRGLARRMLAEVNGDLRERLVYGFRLCVARKPGDLELNRLESLFKRQLQIYRQDAEGAKKVARGVMSENDSSETAELAALTMVANVLLNLDETLTKE